MKDSYPAFASASAITAGILSILYAILFLFVSRANPFVGSLGSWIVLGASGFFALAAYVALYQRLHQASSGFALYALLLGGLSAFAVLQHGAFEAIELIRRGSVDSALGAPSQVDAAGLASFGVVGVVAFLWGWLILKTNVLPRNLGYLGMFNAVLLVVLFCATVAGSQALILISGGLTSVIVGPLYWIWLGRTLANQKLNLLSEQLLAKT